MNKVPGDQAKPLVGLFHILGLALILLLTTSHMLPGQYLNTLKAPNRYISNIQGYAHGDSLFLMYSYKFHDSLAYKNLLLLPDNSGRELQIPELYNKTLLGVIDAGDSIYFYYPHTKEKHDVVMKAIVYSKLSRKSATPNWEVDMPKRIIGITMENGLVIVGTDPSSNTLNLVTINRFSVKRLENYTIDPDFSLKKIQRFGFISEAAPAESAAAAAEKKIFLTRKALFITEDRHEIENGSTKILRIDRFTGKMNRKVVFENSKRSFGSFIHEELFYHVAKDKELGFEVTVYDTAKALTSFTVNRKSNYVQSDAWLRNEVDMRVLKRSVLHVIDGRGQPYMVVHTGDSGRHVIELGMHQVGTQRDAARDVGMPVITGVMGAVNPALGVALQYITLTNSLLMPRDYNSVDKYFFLQKDGPNGFVFTEKSGLVKQEIDDYDSRAPARIGEKVYVGNGNVVYGLYRPEEYPQEIQIIRFKRK
jgi:hypothetical protein